MTKKKKASSGKSDQNRRFGKRRENYVDSFRWGFVEGEPVEDIGPDDELFFGEPDDEEAPASAPEGKGKPSRKKKNAPSVKAGEKSGEKKGEKPKRPGRDAKKPARKVVPPKTFFDDDDDDDLNLPSYGRTPIPTDDELPQPVAKETVQREKAASKQASGNRDDKKTGADGNEKKNRSDSPKVERETGKPRHRDSRRDGQTTVQASSERPRREQMVWDPEQRIYVPLEVPEPRRKRDRTKSVDKESEREPKKAVREKAAREKTAEEKTVREKAVREKPGREKSVLNRAEPVEMPRREPEAETPRSEPAPKKAKRSRTQKPEPKSEAKQERQKEDGDRGRSPRLVADEAKPDQGRRKKGKKASKPTDHSTRPPRGDVPPLVESNVPDPADVEAEVRGFAELGVSETMLEALKIVRYLEPTPIQSGVFKQVQAGVDVMGQAQTGTGKTAAFSIPIIEGVEECPPGTDPVALILVPTRELAVQVRDEAARLTYGRDVRIAACYGGKPIVKQISKLREGVDIVVGTPGRILDLMNRRALTLDALRWVVLDEADRMLDIGFRPDIEKILKRTPKERQTLLFSATLPAPVVRLAERYMKSPEVLDFSNKGVAVETIEQYYVTVDPERKFDALLFLLEEQQPNQAIIFTRTKRGADRLARLLSKRLDSLAAIHGDLSQGERDRVMGQFRSGKLRYLVATDVVGRGIDVSGISHIINFDIPAFCDDYVHRVGRTGRMGREGVAYTFVTVQEGTELTRIEMRIDKLLKRADLKGFESYTKPTDPNANIDDVTSDDAPEAKPVYGKPVRKIRRAL